MPALHLALFEPDQPQNVGTVLRLGAVLGVPVHIIRPTGFVWDDRRLKRAGMDYLDRVTLHVHASWADFSQQPPGRLVLVETDGTTPLPQFTFTPGDCLLFGRESAGTPRAVYGQVGASLHIPQMAGERSLNLATAVAVTTGVALQQLKAWPG